MGHRISALIGKSPINEENADKYDLPFFNEGEFVIIGLHPSHADYWDEKLGFKYEKKSNIIIDTMCTHFLAKELEISKFVIFFTDYFGGLGGQIAVVYEYGEQIMKPTKGGINKALIILGVQKSGAKDEFDSIKLGKYRDFDDYFEKYEDL